MLRFQLVSAVGITTTLLHGTENQRVNQACGGLPYMAFMRAQWLFVDEAGGGSESPLARVSEEGCRAWVGCDQLRARFYLHSTKMLPWMDWCRLKEEGRNTTIKDAGYCCTIARYDAQTGTWQTQKTSG